MAEKRGKAANEAAAEECRIFPTAKSFHDAVERYFRECDENGILYGEAGMCLALSKYNPKGKIVTLHSMRNWYDGVRCAYLQDEVQAAYMRIQEQIETNPVYHEKNMATRGIFLQKQIRFGGYQDKVEQKSDTTVRIIHGTSIENSDFE